MAGHHKIDRCLCRGLGVSLFMAWLGLSQLWRWYTTGELLASFRGMDHIIRWQLITYESHPFNFVSLFAIYGTLAVAGMTICAMQCLIVRRWWRNKPVSSGRSPRCLLYEVRCQLSDRLAVWAPRTLGHAAL